MASDEFKSSLFIKSKEETPQWHVLYVKSRHEKKVNKFLMDEGYRTFLPLQTQLRNYKSKKKWVEEPVFKSYIFIKIKHHQLFETIQFPDVITYVKFEGKPAIVREKELLFIKRLLMNKTTFDLVEGKISVGKKIKITAGPFKGYGGKVSEVRGKNSLVIQLDTLNTNIVISMSDILPPKMPDQDSSGL